MGTENWLKLALLVIVAFGLLQLVVFWELWHFDSSIQQSPFVMTVATEEPSKATLELKPWPTLSSFQPWTRNPNLTPFTCEAYFGNGFIDEHRILNSRCNSNSNSNSSRGGEKETCGSFRCLYSKTLRSSICEGRKVVMNTERITVSRGGEAIGEVVGRAEEQELPEFSDGAFQVQVSGDWRQKLRPSTPLFDVVSVDRLMPRGKINVHSLRLLLLTLRTVDSRSVTCSTRVVEPTLILTRYEYANLFHTSTDWYSAYISSRIVGLPYRPRVVLLDGHCESPMDDGWNAMFSSVTYAKHFSGSVCFDHAIFAPLGYDIPIFKHISSTLNCRGSSVEPSGNAEAEGGSTERKKARLREFGEFFAKSFDTLPAEGSSGVVTHLHKVNVLFVRRENYMAHPRHSGTPESRLGNEEEVYEAMKNWAVEKSSDQLRIKIVNGLLAHMTLGEQIQAVKKADVLVGAHGAGLTHLLFADPATIVFEISSPFYKRPHFATMAYWMGMDYRVLNMETRLANVNHVLKEMDGILADVQTRKYP